MRLRLDAFIPNSITDCGCLSYFTDQIISFRKKNHFAFKSLFLKREIDVQMAAAVFQNPYSLTLWDFLDFFFRLSLKWYFLIHTGFFFFLLACIKINWKKKKTVQISSWKILKVWNYYINWDFVTLTNNYICFPNNTCLPFLSENPVVSRLPFKT